MSTTIKGKNTDTQSVLSVYIKSGKRITIPVDDGYGSSMSDLLTLATREELAGSDDLAFHIMEDNIIINNGTEDLSKLKGLDLVRGYQQTLQTDLEGHVTVEVRPRLGSGKTIVTHNFCDPCTWYQKSTLEDGGDGYGAVLTDEGSQTVYDSAHTNWIDVKHGRLTGEDLLPYGVSVTVEGSAKTEDTDFTVDYENGKITFNPALNPSDEVKAVYHYAASSTFTIGPDAGKKLRLLYTEAQFSINAEIPKPITFQVWVYNPQDLPNKVPYGNPEVYKSGYDLANIGNGGAYVPAFGGIEEDVVIIPFNYATVKDLASSVGAEIRISVQDDTPCDGYFGSLTAYCLSEDE